MAGTPDRRASDGATFSTRFERGRAWLAALVPVLLVGGLLLARALVTTLVWLPAASPGPSAAPTWPGSSPAGMPRPRAGSSARTRPG